MHSGAALELRRDTALSVVIWCGGDMLKCTKSFVTCWILQAFCNSFSWLQGIGVGVALIFLTLKDSVRFQYNVLLIGAKNMGLFLFWGIHDLMFFIGVLETQDCYFTVDHSCYVSLMQPVHFWSDQKMAEVPHVE